MKKVAAPALFFLCVFILVFSAAPPASTHEMYGTTAKEASDANMGSDDQEAERAVKDFVLHVKEHRARIMSEDAQVEFRNALRNSNGIWRQGDMYVITVNKVGGGEQTGTSVQSGDIVFFHGKYPGALSGSLRNIPIFLELIEKVEGANGEAVCVQDGTGEHGSHICAVEDSHMTPPGSRNSFIQLAGFNHERDDVDHSKAEAACPRFTRDELEMSGWLSADMVGANDEESLVRYLKGVEAHIAEEFAKVPGRQSGNDAQGRLPLLRMIQLMPCWRMWPWESGSIYFYIVTGTDRMYGIFNGNSPQLQDRSLRLVDDNGVEVAKRILEEVDRQDDTPGEGFLTYLWEDPSFPGDEVVCEETGSASGPSPEDEDVFCEEVGTPIPGRSPGTSVKIGYFIRTDFGIEGGTEYVLGSGIYPRSGQGGSDGGGCAVASGSGNELEAAVFNLFLITVALFLAISGKRRA